MWVFVGIIFFISFYYFFVCVDPNSGGCLSAMRKFLLVSFPSLLKMIGTKILGTTIISKIEAILFYIQFKSNPLG